MYLAAVNKPKQLLYLTFIGQVGVAELEEARQETEIMLADLAAGFSLLADFSRLDSMDVNCAPVIGQVMDLCDEKGVGQVVRVIPDPSKDIGMNILSIFHYRHRPTIITCDTMLEAARSLSL